VTVGHNPRSKKGGNKNPGINPGQPVGKGKKKKTLVLTMGRSGAYTANPPEKGGKKKPGINLGQPVEKGQKKEP
jgi:hypothetical protein